MLRRSIGPFQLTLHGLGSMLGSGIYGLIGQAAGQSGNVVWLAFIVALLAALLTALFYASLGSRYPRAGGAAFVAQRAFGMPLLSFVVGLAVVCSGLTSIATQSQVFALNLGALLGLPFLPIWVSFGLLAIESTVYLGNGLKCPLSDLAVRYGAVSGRVFDTFLPERWTRYTFRFFGALMAIGLFLLAGRWVGLIG